MKIQPIELSIVNRAFGWCFEFVSTQVSILMRVAYYLFIETISFSLELLPLPTSSSKAISATPIEATSLHDFSSYLATYVEPLSSSISLKLSKAKQLESEQQQEQHKLATQLYLTMQAHIQEAQNWAKTHPEICKGKRYHELESEMLRNLRIVDSITRINPKASFLQDTPGKMQTLPVGLINENGNDCFMIAVMQLLMGCRSLFENVMMQLPLDKFGTIRAQAAIYRLAQIRKNSAPLEGSRALRDEVNMQTGRQEDASEALDQILGSFDLGDDPGTPLPLPFFWMQARKQFNLTPEDYNEMTHKSQSMIDSDGWLAPRYEPVRTLPLALHGNALESALREWSHPKANGSDGYKVETTTGTKVLSYNHEENYFMDLPSDFLFCLNRFKMNDKGKKEKIDRTMDIPERFVIHENMVKSGANGKYQIDGFISHLGNSAESGHYIAYIRQRDGIWMKCDDRSVSKVSQSDLLTALQTGYIFYAKKIRKLTKHEADAYLLMRELQTNNLQMQKTIEVSRKNAENLTPEKQIESLKQTIESIEFFLNGLQMPNADHHELQTFFKSLPKDFQTLCNKVLKLENKSGLTDLIKITTPYLINNRNIVEQYLYLKKQLLALMQEESDHEQSIQTRLSLQLKQLYASRSLFLNEAVSKEHLDLISPFLLDEIQNELKTIFEKPFDIEKIQLKVKKIIESCQSAFDLHTPPPSPLHKFRNFLPGSPKPKRKP